MKIYRDVVFLQGDDYLEFETAVEAAIGRTDHKGTWSSSAFEYLMQWESGEANEESPREPWGTSDQTYTRRMGDSTYVLSVNERIGYVGLTEVIERD